MYQLVHSIDVPHGTLGAQDAAKEKTELQSGTAPGKLPGGFYTRGNPRSEPGHVGQNDRNQQADVGPLLRGARCHRGDGDVASRGPAASAISSERVPRWSVASICACGAVGADDECRVPRRRSTGYGSHPAKLERIQTRPEILRGATAVVGRDVAAIPARSRGGGDSAAAVSGGDARLPGHGRSRAGKTGTGTFHRYGIRPTAYSSDCVAGVAGRRWNWHCRIRSSSCKI